MLHKHKELLKKDIAKKRAMQEKELQIEIHREIENLKRMHNVGRIDTSPTTKGSECHIPQEQFRSPAGAPRASSTPVPDTRHQKSHPELHEGLSNDLHNTYGKEDGSSRKRRRQSSGETPAVSSTHHSASSSTKKRKNSSSGSGTGSRRDRVYCICRKKYDPTKFYVGCDVCNEWFHGNCVGITEAMSKDMTEFICDACSKARDNQEIFCLCKQPYDETQFYIGCEGCPDWYHGRCV